MIQLVNINKLIMKLVLYLLTLLILPQTISQIILTNAPRIQTFPTSPPSNPVTYRYTFQGMGNNACQIKMAMTPGIKQAYSALMIASTQDNGYPTSLSGYMHLNALTTTIADLQNANKGQPQTVQLINNITAGKTIYIKVYVFDTSSNFSWTINVIQQIGLVSKCPNLIRASSINQYCANCNGIAAFGAYCNISEISLTNGSLSPKTLLIGEYAAFIIPGANSQIDFQYSADMPNIQVFVQFKTFSTETAGLINCVVTPSGPATYMIDNATKTYQITINSGGSDVSIGVINHNNAIANLSTQYSTQTPLNILVIVLGVLGGLLLIALIGAAFFIIRRIRSPGQIIHPQASAAMRQSLVQQNMLTAQQIQTYFPSVSCRLAINQLESSSINLKKQQKSLDTDCVICLCPIDGNELMKVTYCRHLFHSHCLVQWFKKQRNCPYCREEYSKSSTIDHYQHVLKESNTNLLAGGELVNEILKSKIKSSVVIEDLKD